MQPETSTAPALLTTRAQLALASALALGVVSITGQFQQTFHAHDDWFMHLPVAPLRFLWYAETEGRWLTFLWSHVSWHLLPAQTFLLSICLHAVATAAITVNVYRGFGSGLVFLAIFFSPFVATLMQWSAQQAAALAVLSMSSVGLYYAKTPRWQVVVATIGQAAAFLSYPGIAPLILLQLTRRTPPARADLLVRLASLPIALAIAGGILLSANWLVLGTFGLPLAEWREPNSATGFAAFIVNIRRFLVDQAAFVTWWPDYVALLCLALALGLSDRRLRPTTGTVLVTSGVVLGLEAVITLATGVSVPSRARAWLWVMPVIIVASHLDSPARNRRWASSLVLGLFLASGAYYWIRFYGTAQRALDEQAALVIRAQTLKSGASDRVVFSGRIVPLERLEYRDFSVLPEARWFVDFADAAHRLSIVPCQESECAAVSSHQSSDVVFRLDNGPVAFRFQE